MPGMNIDSGPKLTKRRTEPSEHQMQAAVIQWWRLNCKRFYIDERLLFAIPNGGARNAITGSLLKAEGVRKGVPDLFLAVRSSPGDGTAYRNGCFIEMKRKGGKISQEQTSYLRELANEGYEAHVCYTVDAAIKELERYASGYCPPF